MKMAHFPLVKGFEPFFTLPNCRRWDYSVLSIQKIQQITILKNPFAVFLNSGSIQKIQQITILKNLVSAISAAILFKKYNKLQSLRTLMNLDDMDMSFKKYNKLQSLRTVIRIIPQKDFNYRLFEHFPDQTSNKKSSNHHLIDYHIP